MFVLFKLKVHVISVQIRQDPWFFFIIIKKQQNHKWLTIESIKSYRGLLFSKSACNRNPTVSEMLTIIDHILFVINICFFFSFTILCYKKHIDGRKCGCGQYLNVVLGVLCVLAFIAFCTVLGLYIKGNIDFI